MDNFLAILNEVWVSGLLGVSMTKIIFSIAVLLLSFLLRGFVVTVVVSSIERLAKSTESSLDDEILKAVKKPLSYDPVTIGIYIVTMILPLEGVAGDISSNIVKALIIFTIFSALANSIHPLFTAMSSTSWLTESMQIWLERSSRVIIWIIGIAIILELFGIQIGPLVAGLGLFSVAVALGAQDFFKNLISGILIIGEKRFKRFDALVKFASEKFNDLGFKETKPSGRMIDLAIAPCPQPPNITKSPSLNEDTPDPTYSTIPAPSMPRANGRSGLF